MKLRYIFLFLAALLAFNLDFPEQAVRSGDLAGAIQGMELTPTAMAKKKKKRKRSNRRGRKRSNSRCKDWPQPACAAKKYKAANGSPRANPKACNNTIRNQCYFVQGYRSCGTNASLPGSATRSKHLCGCAIDLRPGHCSLDHGANVHGTGYHKHYVACSCPN